MKYNSKESRTTITLSCTREDKKSLKQAALDRDTTVSALLHEWVERDIKSAAKK